ncbi:MAG: glycosyltransferase, partial [Bacteroidia bacterium]
EKKLDDRVRFIARLPLEELRIYTRIADVGLTLDKDTNINYRFSLPNKIFDYIHAGIPVLASNLVEVKRIVETYNIGAVAPNHDPKEIAATLRDMFDENKQKHWRAQAEKVKHELCWETEEINLKTVFEPILKA